MFVYDRHVVCMNTEKDGLLVYVINLVDIKYRKHYDNILNYLIVKWYLIFLFFFSCELKLYFLGKPGKGTFFISVLFFIGKEKRYGVFLSHVALYAQYVTAKWSTRRWNLKIKFECSYPAALGMHRLACIEYILTDVLYHTTVINQL